MDIWQLFEEDEAEQQYLPNSMFSVVSVSKASKEVEAEKVEAEEEEEESSGFAFAPVVEPVLCAIVDRCAGKRGTGDCPRSCSSRQMQFCRCVYE